MPVTDQTTSNSSTGNGVTTVFAYTFKILAEADLLVEVDGVEQTLTTHYTVSGVGNSGGGNVTFITAPVLDSIVVRSRDMAYSRETDYQENGDLLAATLDADGDRTTMLVQQVRQLIRRAVKLPAGVTTDQVLPSGNTVAERASKLIGFDASGDPALLTAADVSLTTVSAFIATLLDDADAATARATLALFGSAFDGSNATVAAVNGTDPLYATYASANSDLKVYYADVTGGTRLYLWDSITTLPNIPHTGIKPTFAVLGDILVGDIVALESNPMTYFIRVNAGLAETATTQLFSARGQATDTDGGAGITYAPAKNGGGAVNDGYVDINAYGLGSGALANCVSFATRASAGVSTRRWQVNGQSASKGDLTPVANNSYDIGSSGVGVRELYLGAGASTSTGKLGRVLVRQAATGTGSPANTSENDLKSASILANTLNANGDTLKFRAAFRCAPNATTKRLKVYFGVMVLIDSTAIAHNNAIIVIDGTLVRTGATAQISYTQAIETANGTAWSTAVTGALNFSGGSETLSGAVTLKTTITLGAGAALNDVIQDFFFVEYIPA